MCDEEVRIEPRSLAFVPDHLQAEGMRNEAVEKCPRLLGHFPDHLKAEGMCREAVLRDSYTLGYAPDHFKMQGMCGEPVHNNPYAFEYVTDHFKTEKICKDVVRKESWSLEYVSDRFKTQEILRSIKALREDHGYLIHVPEWFVVSKKMWHQGLDDEEWYKGYKKRKAQKASIKEELIPIAWHPSRWYDCCISEDEKKETEKWFLAI